MPIALKRRLANNAEIRRVEMLYTRLPSSMVAAMLGILVVFTVLFESIGMDLLKAWTAYMLSTIALRLWLWYMFRESEKQVATIRRWEWLFAGGLLLTSTGWATLAGPLFPATQGAQMFVVLLAVMISFTGSTAMASSPLSFWVLIVPTLFPALGRYALGAGTHPLVAGLAAAACLAVFLIVQRNLHRFAIDSFQHNADLESLVEEQSTIFQSSPMGIAVIHDDRVLKCNPRLGELLNRSISDILAMPSQAHFVNQDELEQFRTDSVAAFKKNQLAQGVYRLQRSDGSQFWGEFFGRQMSHGEGLAVWMIADVSLRVMNQNRSSQ